MEPLGGHTNRREKQLTEPFSFLPHSKLSHRKYSLGRPDQRDLSENLAATQGLAHMISEAPRLFQVPADWAPAVDSAQKQNVFS